jgi:hypothetical protein
MKSLAILILSIQVSGCAVYSTEFECGIGKGVGCKSISEVNELVNNGEITNVQIEKLPIGTAFSFKPHGNINASQIVRAPERTARVWMNGFTDAKGDYIGETYVYTVIAPGHWQGSNE